MNNQKIKINNVSVVLGGNVKALDKINLEIKKGLITGLIGPSGAGKSTLVKSIVGSLKLTAGEILVFGNKPASKELRKNIGYMTQELSVYSDLSIKENLKYFGRTYGMKRNTLNSEIEKLLEKIELTEKKNVLVSNLSGGQKQRVSLGLAMLPDPELLILDEPTIGLDPTLRNKLWKLFRELVDQNNKTIILTSHSMDEARRCDDLILIREGRVLIQGSPKYILDKTNSKDIEEAFLKLTETK